MGRQFRMRVRNSIVGDDPNDVSADGALHEAAHYLEICDRNQSWSAIREFANGHISYRSLEDSNTWDLEVMENLEDYGRPQKLTDCALATGRRRLYRAEIMALAVAELAFPEVGSRMLRIHVAGAFKNDLRVWGRLRSREAVSSDVEEAKRSTRAMRLGRRLRRIIERRMQK